jgi:ribonucleoside-diphosphate reductase alpha chain
MSGEDRSILHVDSRPTPANGAPLGKRPRPAVLTGVTKQLATPFGAVFVTVNEDEGHRPFEVFVRLDKAGSRAMADAEAIARLISLALRWGVPAPEVHRQIRGISCEDAGPIGPARILSIPDAIAQAMEHLLDNVRAAYQMTEEV